VSPDLQPGRARAAGQVPGVLALLEDGSPHPCNVTPGPDPWVERPRNARSQPVCVPPSLTRESPHLSEAFAMAPVRAAGCTGSRARRLGWLLSLTALGLFALYVASNSALAALGVAVSLVPGCLLTSCDCSRLAELERRALAWRLTQPW